MTLLYHKSWASLLLLACSLSPLLGCGQRIPTVEGHVTFDGKPVDEGAISFESPDGNGPSAGALISGGQYRIEKITPGKKLVRITAQRKSGKQVPLSSKFPPGMISSNAMVDEVERFIPVNYNEKSELNEDVGLGGNKINFDLKSQ